MELPPLVLQERESLNASIVDAINQAADCWGIRCLRYEIKDIHVPPRVKESMQMQVDNGGSGEEYFRRLQLHGKPGPPSLLKWVQLQIGVRSFTLISHCLGLLGGSRAAETGHSSRV